MLKASLSLAAVLGLAAVHASAATFSVDDFESYSNFQDIATSASSTPWLRYGQVDDDFFASARSAMDGTRGGEIPVGITGTGAATVQRHFSAATDLSSYATASVLAKSFNASPSNAAIQLSITGASGTTYLTNAVLPITDTAATYTFAVDAADTFLADGSDSFSAVLSSVTGIGFRISSPSGAANETINFDDFALQTAAVVPEPATLAAFGLFGALATARRRR